MEDYEIEQDIDDVASEHNDDIADDQAQEQDEPQQQKMVPLKALQATRKELQEMKAQNKRYQEFLMNSKEAPSNTETEEELDSLVHKRELKEFAFNTRREAAEQAFQDARPDAVQEINNYLEKILTKKPWLTDSIQSAVNRYARAYEIVQDYKNLVDPQASPRKSTPKDAERMIQNAQKPRSPAIMGKSAQPSSTEFLKSIQGKKEFREYREKVLRGEA